MLAEPTGPAEQQAAADEHAANELRDAAAHGVRWSAIARPTVEILQLGSIVILARLIVPAEFGRYAIALIAQEVAYLMVAGGLSSALVQRKTIDREHQQTGMALGLLAGLIARRDHIDRRKRDRRPDLWRAHGLLRASDGAAVPRLGAQHRADRHLAPKHGV